MVFGQLSDEANSEIWENVFLMQLCRSITFHKFDDPPAKVCVDHRINEAIATH